MAKKQYCITMEPSIWELAKRRIDGSLSSFIEKQLEVACKVGDEISVLEKEIHDRENELIALRARLCMLKDSKTTENNDSNLELDDAMETLHNIMSAHGFVGKNQIQDIASLHELPVNMLLKNCRDEDIIVHELFEPMKETTRNPVTGKY